MDSKEIIKSFEDLFPIDRTHFVIRGNSQFNPEWNCCRDEVKKFILSVSEKEGDFKSKFQEVVNRYNYLKLQIWDIVEYTENTNGREQLIHKKLKEFIEFPLEYEKLKIKLTEKLNEIKNKTE